MNRECEFEANQLVQCKIDNKNYPFKYNEIVLFLGEIKQMPGHCIIVNRKGKVFWGYHTENFEEPKEEDI